MNFNKIISLEKVKEQLIKSVQAGRVAHAQVFHGSAGGRQLALALAYASYLNCLRPTLTDVCGTCSQCRLFLKYIHPDCHFFYPITKTSKGANLSKHFLKTWRAKIANDPYLDLVAWANAIKADRKALSISKEESKVIIQTASLKPYNANYKIFLIWLPETMNVFSANALLKLLEEPRQKTIFLLVSNDLNSILPTIYSRLQVLEVPAWQPSEIQHFLKLNSPEWSENEPKHTTLQTQGNLQNTHSLPNEEESDRYFEFFTTWMRYCYRKKYSGLAETATEFSQLQRDEQQQFLQQILNFMEQTLYALYVPLEYDLSNRRRRQVIYNFAKTIKPENIQPFIIEVEKAIRHTKRNANSKLLFFNLSIVSFKLFQP